MVKVDEIEFVESWLKEFDLEYHYGLKRQTIRKLEKEGMLHPRKLLNTEGGTYCSVYLLKENKEFFKTYQKVKKTYPKIAFSGSESGESK